MFCIVFPETLALLASLVFFCCCALIFGELFSIPAMQLIVSGLCLILLAWLILVICLLRILWLGMSMGISFVHSSRREARRGDIDV